MQAYTFFIAFIFIAAILLASEYLDRWLNHRSNLISKVNSEAHKWKILYEQERSKTKKLLQRIEQLSLVEDVNPEPTSRPRRRR